MDMPSDDELAAAAAGAGIHRVELSAANEMGTVNAWIVDDDPLTLVDAGTTVDGALATLEAALGALGRRIEDVGLVVLTHHHADHVGLAGEVARRSGAEVAALAPIVPYLREFPAEAARDRAFFAQALGRHGADAAQVAATLGLWERFHRTGRSVGVTVPLEPGSRLSLRDRTLEVLHRPGHSETDVLLVDAERRLVLGGDHLLGTAPSVTVLDRPLPAGDGAATAATGPTRAGVVAHDLGAMPRYRASLRATRELEIDLVLPGHGAAFGAPATVVAAHLERQERAAERLLAQVARAPATAAELLARTRPGADPAAAHYLLSGTLGSLGLLRDDGAVEVHDDAADGLVRFAVA